MPGFERDQKNSAGHGKSAPIRKSRYGGPPSSTNQDVEPEANGAQAQFMAAIDSVSEGFALFDADDRLVFCNRRFREQNPALALNVMPGVSFEEMLRENIATGQILDAIGDEEAYIRARMEQHRKPSGKLVQQRRDGRWLELREERTPDGATLLVNTDITERKQSEEALKYSELHLAQAQQLAHLGSWVWNIRTGEETWSDEQYRIFGYEPQEIAPTYDTFLETLHPDDQDFVRKAAKDSLNGGAPYSCEYRIVRPDGVVRYIRAQGKVSLSADGQPETMFGASLDITESKRAEEALKNSEERFRFAFENAPVGVALISPEGNRFKVNKALAVFLGYKAEDLTDTDLKSTAADFDDLAESLRLQQQVLDGEIETYRNERRYRHKRGHVVWGEVSGSLFRNADGEPEHFITHTIDITERKRAEGALRESEDRFRDFGESASDWFWEMDENLRFTYMSPTVERIVGVTPEWHYGRTREELLADDYDRDVWDEHLQTLKARQPFRDFVYLRVGEGVKPKWLSSSGKPVFDAAGNFLGYRGSGRDITELKQREIALRESEARLSKAAGIAKIGYWVWDEVEGKTIYCSEELAKTYGVASGAELAAAFSSRAAELEWIHPEDRERFAEVDLKAKEMKRGYDTEYRIIDAAGGVRHLRIIGEPVLDERGNLIRSNGITQDITEQKRAEEQLHQAQRMEAVGQLTAGVAHDFNNMLAVISGNAEMLGYEIGADNRLLAAVQRATKRATDLTQRLLAFSSKQMLRPETVNANNLIVETTGLLRSTLEEHIDIETVAGSDLWNCDVDPAQLENALVNLALNARDAMPHGGRLTIETANVRLDDGDAVAQAEVTPGQYVMLAVTDTGTGMPPEIREHVFEPFFTTKEVGAGSGLGLSMVYGFVKQSGGHVTVTSEPGEGTAIKIYLPRSERTLAAEQRPATVEVPVARGETVLVVEDDLEVRKLAVTLLRNLGYGIVEAATGAAALEQLGSATEVNLLLTDVVLAGGMNGRELAVEVARRDSGIPVLYMSGYAEDAIMHHGRLDTGAELLHKPFRKADLARAVRRALDSRSVHN